VTLAFSGCSTAAIASGGGDGVSYNHDHERYANCLLAALSAFQRQNVGGRGNPRRAGRGTARRDDIGIDDAAKNDVCKYSGDYVA